MAIQGVNDKETETFFYTGTVSKKCKWSAIKEIAQRKLDMLDYAAILDDLKSPPGNRLEALKGELEGYFSIRINNQWRCIFTWTPEGPGEVRIADYH